MMADIPQAIRHSMLRILRSASKTRLHVGADGCATVADTTWATHSDRRLSCAIPSAEGSALEEVGEVEAQGAQGEEVRGPVLSAVEEVVVEVISGAEVEEVVAVVESRGLG